MYSQFATEHPQCNTMARWLLSIFGLFVVLQAYGSLAYPKGRFAKAPKPQWSYVDHGKDPLACALCLDAMKEVYKLATANRTEQCLEALVDKFCKVLNIEDSTVCRGAIAEYGVSRGFFWFLAIAKICSCLFRTSSSSWLTICFSTRNASAVPYSTVVADQSPLSNRMGTGEYPCSTRPSRRVKSPFYLM